MRKLVAALAPIVFLCGLTVSVSVKAAEPYPTKPVRLIVPFPPGGGSDVVARIMALKMAEFIGESIVVENRPGAGGTMGAEAVARAEPDGYVILMGSNSTQAINPSLYTTLRYDPIRDFEAIGLVAAAPNILVVHPNLQARNVQELIDLAKKSPGSLSYGSAGAGTTQHLAGALFNAMTGAKILHVPYKGAGPAMTDLLGGRVSMAFDTLPSALANVRSGKLRALGVGSAGRSPFLPDVPTIGETLPGYEVGIWYAMFAPKGVSREILERLNDAINKSVNRSDVQALLQKSGLVGVTGSRDDLAARLEREIPRWRKVVQDAGAKIE